MLRRNITINIFSELNDKFLILPFTQVNKDYVWSLLKDYEPFGMWEKHACLSHLSTIRRILLDGETTHEKWNLVILALFRFRETVYVRMEYLFNIRDKTNIDIYEPHIFSLPIYELESIYSKI